MFENTMTLVVAAAFLTVFLASSVGISFFVGRRSAARVASDFDSDSCGLPDRFVQEVERCLELSEYVSRDVDSLSAALIDSSRPLPRETASAVQQLIKTTRGLAGRVNRLGVEARVARPEYDRRASSLLPLESPLATAVAADSRRWSHNSQPSLQSAARTPDDSIGDARRFTRSSFPGRAEATIFPQQPGREPVQCTVMTRDLSSTGIGIAHTEQLYPKQIVVLNAVGKLLVGEVRWCRRVDEQFYVAGCRLVKTHC